MKKSKEVSKEVQEEQYRWFDTRKHFRLLQNDVGFCAQLEHEARKMPERELKEFIFKVMGEVEEVKGKMNIELLRLHYLHEEMEKAYRIKSD